VYIEEIWEVNYEMSLQIPVFKCQWVKHPQGVEVDEYGFTIIDLRNVGHKDEPWVLALTVAQVFYILDPNDEKKHIVVRRQHGGWGRIQPILRGVFLCAYNKDSNVITYSCTDGEGKFVHV
jgi:hypothetical protein